MPKFFNLKPLWQDVMNIIEKYFGHSMANDFMRALIEYDTTGTVSREGWVSDLAIAVYRGD